MPEGLKIFFDFLIQFTGDGGGHRPGIVPYGVAGMFWLGLLLISKLKYRAEEEVHQQLLEYGFIAGFLRQVFMLTVKIAEGYGILTIDQLHLFFPPLEHALADIAEILIASGYILYLTGKKEFSYTFMRRGIIAVSLCYVATSGWWWSYISANPESKFGQTWCDWVFRVNASFWLGYAVIFMINHSKGWTRRLVCTALTFFFLDDFLKIPDMILDERYEAIFAPIRHGLYLLAVPILAYVYIREHATGIRKSFDELDVIIDTRTQDLQNTSKELEESLSMQKSFTDDASHELRTPLSIILNETEWVLEQTRGSQQYQGSLSVCRTAALHMNSLVNQLLELTKSDVKGIELSKSVIDLPVFIKEVLGLMKSISQKKNIELKAQLESASLWTQGDLTKLRQALINLINNAVNHSPEGSEIVVALSKKETRVQMSVIDQGIGIAEEELGHIFKRFYQSNKSRTGKGLGLGLSVCQAIANAHGGQILVNSKPDHGSTFTLEIPILS